MLSVWSNPYWLDTRVYAMNIRTYKENTLMMPMAVKDIPYLTQEKIDFTYFCKEDKVCP